MVGLFRRIEGKKRKLRFIAVDEIFDWHKYIYQAKSLKEFGKQKDEQCIACAFSQRAACKYFACKANEREDKTDIWFDRI